MNQLHQMKQQWLDLAKKIDAMSVRERVLVFAAIMAVLVMLMKTVFADPLLAQQKKLSSQLRDAQSEIFGKQVEITQKMELYGIDPDIANRQRVLKLTQESERIHRTLFSMQKDLVAPDKVATLLESILKQNGKLRLLSLKTLAGTGMDEVKEGEAKADKDYKILDSKDLMDKVAAAAAPAPAAAASPAAANAAVLSALIPPAAGAAADKAEIVPPEGPIFRHGVELKVQGSYLDLLDYMQTLEALPWQLYWGKAQLEVTAYPHAILTINVHTLSLDQKWLNL